MFFLSSAHPWPHYSHSYCWNENWNGTLDPDSSWFYWHHLLQENPQYLQNLFKEKDVMKASILKAQGREEVSACHEACTAKPVQGYFWSHNIYCLFCCWCGISEIWMFIWLNEKVAKCFSLLHLHVKTVPTQPSCLTSGADGEAASSFAPLLRNVDERWLRRNQTSLTGRWLPRHCKSWLVYCLSHLSWVWGDSSSLKSSDFCCPICHAQLLLCYSLVFFLLLSCHCLSGLGHYICTWSSMVDIKCIFGVFSLCLFRRLQGSQLHSNKLSVCCHVMLMLLLPVRVWFQAFIRTLSVQ